MEDSARVESMLDGLVTLPSLPTTVVRVMELLDNPDASLQDVGKVLAQDPALSIKALRLVNSAFYSLRNKVNSVERGIVLLGVKVVHNLVVTASVFETMKGGESTLLRHAIACGTAGRILTKHAGPDPAIADPAEAFMYGLLHDIGKIILQQSVPDKWAQIAKSVGEGKYPAYVIESREAGVDHAEIGGLLGKRWKLQEDLVAAIAGHHDLTRCATPQQRKRAAFVGIADWMCYQAGFPALTGGVAIETPGQWDETGINPASLTSAVDELGNSKQTVEEFLSLAA